MAQIYERGEIIMTTNQIIRRINTAAHYGANYIQHSFAPNDYVAARNELERLGYTVTPLYTKKKHKSWFNKETFDLIYCTKKGVKSVECIISWN